MLTLNPNVCKRVAYTGLTVVRTSGDGQTYQGYTPEALRPRMSAIGSALTGLLGTLGMLKKGILRAR